MPVKNRTVVQLTQGVLSRIEERLGTLPKIPKAEIRAWRLKHILTQGELAKKLGVTKSTVSGWETGRIKPNPRSSRKLAVLMGKG